MTPRHVFVYGTLRRGQANDINCLRPMPRFVGMAGIPGTLYHLGAYPGMILGTVGQVQGEVYAIEPALEVVLDEIEGVRPQDCGEYFKREVSVPVDGKALLCLVYELNPIRAHGRPVIATGNWAAVFPV